MSPLPADHSLTIYSLIARLHVLEIMEVVMYLPKRSHLGLPCDSVIDRSESNHLHGVDPVCMAALAPCVCNATAPKRHGTAEVIIYPACLVANPSRVGVSMILFFHDISPFKEGLTTPSFGLLSLARLARLACGLCLARGLACLACLACLCRACLACRACLCRLWHVLWLDSHIQRLRRALRLVRRVRRVRRGLCARCLVAAVGAVRRDVIPRHLHTPKVVRRLKQRIQCRRKRQAVSRAILPDDSRCPAADTDRDGFARPARPLCLEDGGTLCVLGGGGFAGGADDFSAHCLKLMAAFRAILFHDSTPSCRSRGIHIDFVFVPRDNYILIQGRACVK